jgi:hypothetical protein
MKVKKIAKLAPNMSVVISFNSYKVPYKALKMITDNDILNSKISAIDIVTNKEKKPYLCIYIDSYACNFKSIEPPAKPKQYSDFY